jgi:hypothetical protein
MVIQFFAHPSRGSLRDQGLNNVCQVFKRAEKNNGNQINTAVHKQQVNVSQINGLIDNALLHFQRHNPGKNHHDNDKQKRYLKLDIAGKYPGKKRSFDDGYFSFFHFKAPSPRINGSYKRVESG